MSKSEISKIWLCSKEELNKIVLESKCYKDILLKLGYKSIAGATQNNLKERLIFENISCDHFQHYYSIKNIKNNTTKLEDLIENSKKDNHSIKNFLIKTKTIEYKCLHCNNDGKWNGKELSLQLDHINGVNNDNRIENLRFLCPNCHTQTDTHSGKNKLTKKCEFCDNLIIKSKTRCNNCSNLETKAQKEGKIKKRKIKERPSYEILIKDVEELGFRGTGRKYNVNYCSIKQWIKNYEKENDKNKK